MNITAILLIAVIGIMFLVLEIILINLLIDSIRGKDLFLSCIGGLTLIGVCILEILTFITICPQLKQDRYTDYRVEQKVIGIEKAKTAFSKVYEQLSILGIIKSLRNL